MVGKKWLGLLVTMLLCFYLLAFGKNQQPIPKHVEVDFSVSCVECHSEVTPEIVKEWKGSKHGLMNFACYLCHGDGKESFFPKPNTERCIGCHSDHEVDFSALPLENCFDCHGGHTLKFHK